MHTQMVDAACCRLYIQNEEMVLQSGCELEFGSKQGIPYGQVPRANTAITTWAITI